MFNVCLYKRYYNGNSLQTETCWTRCIADAVTVDILTWRTFHMVAPSLTVYSVVIEFHMAAAPIDVGQWTHSFLVLLNNLIVRHFSWLWRHIYWERLVKRPNSNMILLRSSSNTPTADASHIQDWSTNKVRLLTHASFILDQTPRRRISRKQPMQRTCVRNAGDRVKVWGRQGVWNEGDRV